MRARTFIATLCVAQLAWAANARAAAQTLEELLQAVRSARSEETAQNAEREQQFKARRDKQAQLLKEARATRDALAYARQVLEREAGSTTYNPLVFAD